MVKVTLPDGTKKEYKDNITIGEVASNIGNRLGEMALAGKASGVLVDLSFPIKEDISLSVITEDTEEGLEILRHSTAHIMAQAVSHLFPGVKLGIGPTIENGFYYDFGLQHSLSDEDLKKIEEEMARIIREDISFKRMELPRDLATKKMEALGQSFKVELIKDIEDDTVSFYTQGDFEDLCRGPHIHRTSKVKAFKLLSVAGAYWRGKETNPMLQRIYGTAFFTQKELDKYLKFLEEAEKRDHRKIGRDLDLFSFHEEGGPGLTFWHPKGARIRNIIENFWREEHFKRGYDIVYSPHIAKINLWKTSGHWNFYRESMYSPIEVDGQEYILKPMNCPFAVLIYKTKLHSYRDLPLRWGELGTVYRYERSGVLHGLLRVRGFTQDDAHIFCTPDQLENEILGVIELAQFMLSSFGFNEYEIELSVRGKGEKEKYIGRDEVWDHAENALKIALDKKGLKYTRMEGEAKFYGPAIDIKVKDAIGRGWQGPTIQVDFNLPERFDVKYVGSDGNHHRVVMVHRTVLGAMERFVGCLIEHYAGDFPLWIAPIQMRILPITDAHIDYAKKLQAQLLLKNFRVECDTGSSKINYKIREGTLEKIPYLLIVGDKEMQSGSVAVRSRKRGVEGMISIEEFINNVETEIREKK
ncbi:MAG TPA: threonine--tRNA ligase [Candidatus Wunengus sp. YC61]|uniref:threonine--tRNA ligase n=1 Tax=Candidatus Wunengus sp. YC61 TaxID=3367698 RepID=UPI004024D2E0